MKILVIGNGGREHALSWKISKSPLVKKIYCCEGNPGTSLVGENINIKSTDIPGILKFAAKNSIDLTVVGPELPLTMGIVDEFEKEDLPIFGPSKAAAELEGSKLFSKNFMKKYQIPTAEYETIDSADAARGYIENISIAKAVVIKADGLAAGKGVVICKTKEEALSTIDSMMVKKKFGEAGNKIIIEEFLEGEEVSFLTICDGKNIVPLISAKDHKTLLDGNEGPNTGGMGAYCPSLIVTEELHDKIINEVVLPTVKGMSLEGRTYKGVLYAGLMINDGNVKVLEFNCRFGDPETQPIVTTMRSDIVPLLTGAAYGNLEGFGAEWRIGVSACIVMASGGYPGGYETSLPVEGLESIDYLGYSMVFHAGTKVLNDKIVTSGGRVLGITALGDDLEMASKNAYHVAEQIQWKGLHYRKDIGK